MKKAWSYITNKQKRAVWLRAFRMWQRRTPMLAPLSTTEQKCSSCGTEFCGNYCPRCGQAASVGRFSFKKAFMLFLDVWGMGNRSMIRTIRDLMLRPGYLIRDYLSGMQSAYFPPFKLFFLLVAFSLIVEHGLSLGIDFGANGMGTVNERKQQRTELVEKTQPTQGDVQIEVDDQDNEQPALDEVDESSAMYKVGQAFAKMMIKLKDSNPAIFVLITLLMISWPLYFFLRSSPAIPELRYSEFVVALVYVSNTYTVFSIVGNLLHSHLVMLLAVLMVFVALKQFSGYSKLRLLGYIVLTTLISFVAWTAVVALVIYIIYINV